MLTRRPPHWRGAPLSLLGPARPDVGNLGTKRAIKGEPSLCCRVPPGGQGRISTSCPIPTLARRLVALQRRRGIVGRPRVELVEDALQGADARRQWVAIFGDRAS